jgi:tetratricopeptide (TPR) repeat protein
VRWAKAACALAIGVCLAEMGDGAPPPVAPAASADLRALVAATAGMRLVEGRVAGGFAYAPRTGPQRSTDPNRLVLAAALPLLPRPGEELTPARQAASATAYLLTGSPADAIRLLERALAFAGERAPAEWSSDLAAAYLARAEAGGAFDRVRALVAAERAVARSPTVSEAWFNRALALERLGLPEAGQAWDDYRRRDPRSGFAQEAADHARRLAAVTATPPATVASGDVGLTDLEPYARWASAVVSGDAGAQNGAIARASGRAHEYAGRGDRFHALVVLDLQRATAGSARHALAQGILALVDGTRAAESDDFRRADDRFREARDQLDPRSEGLAALARYRAAISAYYRQRYADAASLASRAAAFADRRGCLVLQARALRLQGLIDTTTGRYAAALQT